MILIDTFINEVLFTVFTDKIYLYSFTIKSEKTDIRSMESITKNMIIFLNQLLNKHKINKIIVCYSPTPYQTLSFSQILIYTSIMSFSLLGKLDHYWVSIKGALASIFKRDVDKITVNDVVKYICKLDDLFNSLELEKQKKYANSFLVYLYIKNNKKLREYILKS